MNLTTIQIEALTHAIRTQQALEGDLARLYDIDATTDGLIADCLERRRATLNALRHIQQRFDPLSPSPVRPSELMINAASGPCGVPEIAPEPMERTNSALARWRRRQRWINRVAIVISIVAACVICGCIRFAFLNLK